MKSIVFLCIFLLTANYIGYAQAGSNKEKITQAYSEYFKLPREAIFLHLNKSTYIAGEELWFKGYIYDSHKGLPFTATTNIQVSLYDSIGAKIKQKKFIANNGFTKGNFSIDSTYKSGTYYIKATTNWMRNFKEDKSHLQKITIYNKEIPSKKTIPKREYDIQLLPEGGHIIANISNTIAVKAIDQYGNGIPFKKAILKDEFGYELLTFGSSIYGLAKFDFVPNPAIKYTALFIFENGDETTIDLPKTQKEGIILSVKKHNKEQVAITLKTNDATKSKIQNKVFSVFIHRDGHGKMFDAKIPNHINYAIFLMDIKEFYKGINIITLFDKETPISERLFFNKNMNLYDPLASIETHLTHNQDSIAVTLNTSSKKKNVSISVLPENTLSYNHKDNILSALYLKPYLRGSIENPSYYFKNFNKDKEASLDLLLLTQGWSKYSWQDIFNNPPKEDFIFKNGEVLKGRMNVPLSKREEIYLHPGSNFEGQTIAVKNNQFLLNGIFPTQGDTLKFSIITSRGKLKPPKMYIKQDLTAPEIKIKDTYLSEAKTSNTEKNTVNLPSFYTIKDALELNEVVLTGKKKRISESNVNIPTFIRSRVTEVDENTVVRARRFADIIRANGYEVIEELSLPDSNDIGRVSIRRRQQQSFLNLNNAFPIPLVYLDGVQLFDFDFDILLGLKTEDVESFYFDRTGATAGSRGAGGVIYINTRRNRSSLPSFHSQYSNKKSIKVFSYNVPQGFETPKTFYNPKYASYDNIAFENFGVIHWEPDAITDKKGIYSFMIPHTGVENALFFIEGMSEDGQLFSIEKKVQISSSE
ncbi:hypothetical protein [uncultured Dokdonia sp.]|uniref:hypothetical protein n=1 Tax=uncultured Dokdonia sp. TaxID=575653 RepID=UPI00261EFFD3|nr:hypothetical protein [uncultured Dokdonia sp.]